MLPLHVDILSAVTQINEPDSLYGIIQSHKALAFRDISPQAPTHILIIPKVKDGLSGLSKDVFAFCFSFYLFFILSFEFYVVVNDLFGKTAYGHLITCINLQQSKTSSSSLFSTNRLHSCSRALDHGNFSFKRLDHDYSVLHKLVSLVDMEFKILLEEIKSRNYVEVKCIRFW
ncbi:hypothetical protein CMV_016922 [Castanea mollissima]|uniref:HIT domain-containing protein n=1 Tax=Castanea mollissima TaxID=60419 RepID=A0A8J4VR84_9ROSI|nr:hypothetical protein CMV_016922 [Castanea mollissima]